MVWRKVAIPMSTGHSWWGLLRAWASWLPGVTDVDVVPVGDDEVIAVSGDDGCEDWVPSVSADEG